MEPRDISRLVSGITFSLKPAFCVVFTGDALLQLRLCCELLLAALYLEAET